MRRLLPLLPLILAGAACQQPAVPSGENVPSDQNKADGAAWSGPQAPAPVAGQGSLPAGKLDRSHAGEPAPAATFQDPEGKSVSFGHFGGKPLLVNLWATWCGPCIVEMPTIDALAKREAGSIEVLALSQDMGDGARAKVDAFFAERRFEKLRPYLDSKMDVMAALKVDTLPTTIFYGADGKEIWRMTGIEDWQSVDAAKLLAEGRK
jgi:thiol-disulfide isomerase/thioredoxin